MMIVWGFVMFALLLGFPFFVLVVAKKQEGWMKYAGWILAGLFTLFLLVSSVFVIARIGNGGCAGGRMGCQMMGGPGMMGRGGMGICNGAGMCNGQDPANCTGNCPTMGKNGTEWNKLGIDRNGRNACEDQGPRMMIKMLDNEPFQDEKNMDSFIENLRKDQKVFDQFKAKINAPAPKKDTTTTKTLTTPTPTTPKNP